MWTSKKKNIMNSLVTFKNNIQNVDTQYIVKLDVQNIIPDAAVFVLKVLLPKSVIFDKYALTISDSFEQ